MAEFKNTMDVFKLLEKTNCRKCNKPTCLVFAAEVFQGWMRLGAAKMFQKLAETHG